jgi:hypothetical protein
MYADLGLPDEERLKAKTELVIEIGKAIFDICNEHQEL